MNCISVRCIRLVFCAVILLCGLGLAGLGVNAGSLDKEGRLSAMGDLLQVGKTCNYSRTLMGAKRVNETEEETNKPVDVAVDASGNTYITGQWQNLVGGSSFTTISYDRTGKQRWLHTNNTIKDVGRPTGMAVNPSGVYITGSVKRGGGSMIRTEKYACNGTVKWVHENAAPANRVYRPAGIALDGSGNSYVAGDVQVTDKRYDFTTFKLDDTGRQIWKKTFNGPYKGSSGAVGVLTDSSGYIYVTGDTETGPDQLGFATFKLDGKGKILWTSQFQRTGSDVNLPVGFARSQDYLYVGGSTLKSDSQTAFTIVKLNAKTGKRVWTRNYGSGKGSDTPVGIAADRQGNVLMTGQSANGQFLTLKYDGDGNLDWVRTYSGVAGGEDYPVAITVDSKGRVYVVGSSTGTGDGTDFATLKYAPSGQRRWVQRFNGRGNGTDTPADIAVDSTGHVYVTGQSQLNSRDEFGFATVKYDSSGNQNWVTYFSGE